MWLDIKQGSEVWLDSIPNFARLKLDDDDEP